MSDLSLTEAGKDHRSNNCPICGSQTNVSLLTLAFAAKVGLPEEVYLQACHQCDFAFTSPGDPASYSAYYASTKTDPIHAEVAGIDSVGWPSIQSANFQDLLDQNSSMKVLDYGCGGGDLLRHLSSHFPQHHFCGFDINVSSGSGPANSGAASTHNIHFCNSLSTLRGQFDVLILSHVLEHILDFQELHGIVALLKTGGIAYIEVPNPSEYRNHLRRDFLGYIDRLHVNHFSLMAIIRLGRDYNLQVLRYGVHTLPDKEKGRFPAQFVVFEKGKAGDGTMIDSLADYISVERERHTPLSDIDPSAPILVYGFGDNFHRCSSPGGPLHSRNIKGIIDKRAKDLAKSPYGNLYHFFTLDEALQEFPNLPIVITVSWGADEIARSIRMRTDARVLLT